MKDFILQNKKVKEFFFTTLSICLLLIIWKTLSLIVDKEIIIPSPESTFREMIRISSHPNFLTAIFNTLRRAIIGFIIALGLGLSLGMLSGFYKPVYILLKPFVLINKAMPTMAMILLALIWLESEKAPILVGFVIIFPIIYENVVQGIRNVDVKLVEMMDIYDVDRFTKFKDLYIPSIRSFLHGATVAAMGLNLKIVVAAEVLSQPRISMGTSFQIERANLNTAGVFAWALITIILAAILEQGLKVLKRI